MIGNLPRREREIFEILCSTQSATAGEIRKRMTGTPSPSNVRTLLMRLESRGLVTHEVVDSTYIYRSIPQPAKVRESALRQMVETLFNGSAASTATALLGLYPTVDAEELEVLQRAIDKAKASLK